jgi:hypothetical protein
MVGLAVVLAHLGDAKAFLHVALGMDREDGRGNRGGKGGGDGDTSGCHAMLHEMMRFLYKRMAQLAFTRRLSFP